MLKILLPTTNREDESNRKTVYDGHESKRTLKLLQPYRVDEDCCIH